MREVTVIDYGAGNLLSVGRALEKCGAKVIRADEPENIACSQKLLLPGVGAFGNAMKALTSKGLIGPILSAVDRGVPLLGICLGMQLLFESSEEFGFNEGLCLIEGNVRRILSMSTSNELLRVPHIGWSELSWTSKAGHELGQGCSDMKLDHHYYFVHSYAAYPKNEEDLLAVTCYGGYSIPAVVGKGKVLGCQFHPEKSGETGLRFLRHFVES